MATFLKLHISYSANLVPPREHKRLTNDMLRNMMQMHLDDDMPQHFERVPETAVGGEYGYAPRSVKYMKRKRARTGQDNPLVYTGMMRACVLNASRITATANVSTLYIRNYYPMSAQRRHELEAIAGHEKDRLSAFARRRYMKNRKSGLFRRRTAKKVS